MLAQQAHRFVRIATNSRLKDSDMLVMRVAACKVAAGCHLPVTISLDRQSGAKIPQPARSALRQKALVKLAVQTLPIRVGLVTLGVQRTRRAGQAVYCQRQGFFPVGRAVGNRVAQSQAFNIAAGSRQRVQLVPDQRCNTESTLLVARHQPLSRQSAQGFPHRAGANAVTLAHQLDTQLLGRFEDALQNVAAQRLIDGAGPRGARRALAVSHQSRFSCHLID